MKLKVAFKEKTLPCRNIIAVYWSCAVFFTSSWFRGHGRYFAQNWSRLFAGREWSSLVKS